MEKGGGGVLVLRKHSWEGKRSNIYLPKPMLMEYTIGTMLISALP